MKVQIVEKKNHLSCHSIHSSLESAQYHLENVIPEYVKKGYYMDKTLTEDDFEIIEYKPKKQHQ